MTVAWRGAVLALGVLLPLAQASAQTPAELQQEINALKAQLQSLQKKLDALAAAPAPAAAVVQQVNRVEQKQDVLDAALEASGLRGFKLSGVIEATAASDTLDHSQRFGAGDGNGATAMIELGKETEEGEGLSWLLRLTPGAAAPVHEATVSFGLNRAHRVVGGLIPDYQGYEFAFAHKNPLISHNVLFDLAGPTAYSGLGMVHKLHRAVEARWMVGNIDAEVDRGLGLKTTAGLAYRVDWTLSEYSTVGFSGAHATQGRRFDVIALDGGYNRGDWLFNGHLNAGRLAAAAFNGGDAQWAGVSGLLGYRVLPRLQLLARADYLHNPQNGGGTYVNHYWGQTYDPSVAPVLPGSGLGPELDASGALVDPTNPRGASLWRWSVGTNYLVNATTQWKTELRLDRSSGHNFLDASGNPRATQSRLATSVVVAF